MKNKTIEEWLGMLEEPYRAKALEAYRYHPLRPTTFTVKSLKMALQMGFLWRETKDGHDYWAKIYYAMYKDGETYSEHFKAEPIVTAEEIFSESSESRKETDKTTMDYNTTPVARPTLVYGEDVAGMNEKRCLQLIEDQQTLIAKLEKLGIESVTIAARISEAKTVIGELVKRLDTFAPPAPAA